MTALGVTLEDAPTPPVASASYAPGDQIAGRYRVIAVVGRGSSGAVYRVLDLTVDEEIAVKIIDDPAGGVARLSREMRLARKVTHANVCRAFDIVEHRHGALLAMEYFAGGTLAEKLGAPMPESDVRAIAGQMLDGLEAAHTAGVIHRDLKPANVLIAADGHVALSDFGIAVPADTEQGTNAGTPAYMAPEQLRGEPADARTDLYSLGLVLHELLVGAPPFRSPRERIERDAPALSGSALRAGITRLVARDRDDRPRDVAEARVALGLTKKRGRWPLVIAAGIGVASIAGIVAAGVTRTRAIGEDRTTAIAPPSATASLALRTRVLTGGEQTIFGAPSFAPDGRGVVAAIARGDEQQLWWMALDDSLSRPITTGTRRKRAPQFAGGFLYFLRNTPGQGGELVRLRGDALETSHADDDVEIVMQGVSMASASSRGDIAFTRSKHGLGSPTLVELRTRDGAVRSLPFGRDGSQIAALAWSPDGTRLGAMRTFGRSAAQGEVWTIDPATGDAKRIVDDALALNGIAWSRDGRGLLFFRGTGDARALVRVDADGGGERVVADRQRDASMPALGEGGRAAIVIDSVQDDLWVLQNGAPFRRVSFFGDEEGLAPTWAGDDLAYLVEKPLEGYEVRLVAGNDFSHVRARRIIPTFLTSVAVSPDAKLIAYGEHRDDEALLQIAELQTNAPPRTLLRTAWPDHYFPPQFAAGGSRVGFVKIAGSEGEPSVWDVRTDGSDARLLIDHAGGGQHSVDDRYIAYVRVAANDGEEQGIYVRALDARGLPTGPSRRIGAAADAYNWRFHPVTGELVMLDRTGVVAVDPKNGKRRFLAEYPPGTRDPDRLAVHASGRIVCSLGVGRSSLVLIESLPDLAR